MAKSKLTFAIAINLLTENFKKGVSQVQSAFSKLRKSALGFVAALGIGGAGIRSFIESTSDFEASVSKLSAILGTTPDKIKALTDNAKKLGESTKYTASEVSNLQIELAKIGFTKDEILNSTEAVLKFAQATDSGLSEAAALAGSALRMFGADVTESKRYVSAMAIATTKSALSFAYLRDALPTVGPVAKAFNFTIEDTLALLGKLADSGFDASSAATATRNILLNLANSGGKLAKALGGNVKTLPELVAGLQKLKEKGVDLNTTLQLTDKRSVAAFNSFLQSAGNIESLRGSITGVEGDLDRMAATMGDNVKGAAAGLSSAWESLMIKLSESTNTPLKNLINWLTSVVRYIKSGFEGLVAFLGTLVGGKLIQLIIGFFAKYWTFINTGVKSVEVAEEQKLQATAKRIEAEKALEAELTAFETKENGKRQGSQQKIKKAEIALAKATAAEKKAILRAETAAEQAAALRSATIWGKMGKTVKLAFAGIFNSLKALLSTFWVTGLITAIGAVIGKLVNMYNEAKRVKNIFSDYKKELKSIDRSPEIAQLKVLQKLYNESAGNKKKQEYYQKRIESIVGTQIKKEQDINDVIKDRIKLLEATATADFYTQKKVEAQSKIDELSPKANLEGISQGNFDYLMQNMAQYNQTGNKKALQKAINTYAEHIRRSGKKFSDDYQDTLLEISGYWQIVKHASSKIETSISEAADLEIKNEGSDTELDLGGKKKKTELQKQEEKYAEQLSELNAKLKINSITQAEYNKALGELNIKMYAEANGTNDAGVLGSDYYKKLKDAAENAIKNQDKANAAVELEKVQKNFADNLNKYQVQYQRGFLSQKELNEKIVSLSVESAKSAVGIKGIGKSADVFVAAMRMNANMLKAPVKMKQRDTTFDYKKSEVDIAQEKLDIAKDYAKQLQESAQAMGETLSDELAGAMADVPTLEEKLKMSQLREDIKGLNKDVADLNKDLKRGIYEGVKSSVSTVNSLVSSFEDARDVLNDVDSTEWEKIMAIWDAMINAVDGFMSIVGIIENLTEITDHLTEAKKKQGKATIEEQVIDTAAAQAKVANAAEGAIADKAAAVVKKETATEEIGANTAEAASEAGKSAASLPFPWNIVAIGGAIAAAIAAMSAIPKFANGGIVPGNSRSGDNVLAGLNSGEMVLNTVQQSRLFRMLNGCNGATPRVTSNVTIGFGKIRGKDISLAIKNYEKSTGKRK